MMVLRAPMDSVLYDIKLVKQSPVERETRRGCLAILVVTGSEGGGGI